MDICVRLTVRRVNCYSCSITIRIGIIRSRIPSFLLRRIKSVHCLRLPLSTCFPSSPDDLWVKYRDDKSEDVLHHVRCHILNPTLQITAEIYNDTLIIIEDTCLLMANKILSCLGMTSTNRPMRDAFNHELQREKQYDSEALAEIVRKNVSQLNQEQWIEYDTLIGVMNSGSGGIYSLMLQEGLEKRS